MALREYLDILFTPRGGMNKDADPLSRKGGDYTHAENAQFLSLNGGTTFNVQPTKGNVPVYALPVVTAQNKVFRIYLDVQTGAIGSYTFRIRTPNGNIAIFFGWLTVFNDVSGTYGAAVLAINAAATVFNQTVTISPLVITSSPTEGYFDFTLTTVSGWDYTIESAFAPNLIQPPQPITVQESIDLSLIGQLQTIGSYDLDSDTIVWSTNQAEMPSTLPILSVTNNGAGLYRVTVTGHGLQTGYRVVISGVTQLTTNAQHNSNGQWIITVIDANNFDLQGSSVTMFANPNTGIITINSQGVGEIGVAQKDDNDETWTYTTLLRTKEWNFRIQKQPKTYCERNDLQASIYWTDDYNKPRKFYYSGLYITNGALQTVNANGQYTYGTINLETILQRGTTFAHITYNAQLGGGAVPAGNHRYCFQFLTEGLSRTLVSDPSNLINTYAAGLAPPENIEGDNAGDNTGKVNQLLITGIIPNLFKYVELIDIYYGGGTPVATIVRRDLLTQQTSQIIQHTGLETNVQVFDLAQLLEVQADIATALNIDAVNNRLILSNTTSSAEIDLTPFGVTLNHSLIREPLQGIMSRVDSTLRAGEYQIPGNLFSFASYALNETYRIGLKPKFKNGYVGSNIWVDDIRFDNNPINTGNPFGDNRRNVGGQLPDFDLTDVTGTIVYAFGFQLTNIDWNFLIDGVPIKDIVEEFSVEYVEMTEPFREIITTGALTLSQDALLAAAVEVIDTGGTTYPRTFVWSNTPAATPVLTDMSDYHSVAGMRLDNPVGTPVVLNPLYTGGADTFRTGSVYAPDIMFGYTDWQYAAGDQIINYGNPEMKFFFGASAVQIGRTPVNSNEFHNNMREFTGFYFGFPIAFNDVLEKADIGYGSGQLLTTLGRTYNKRTMFTTNTPGLPESGMLSNPGSPVVVCQNGFFFSGLIADFGLRNIAVYRPKVNKFGDIAQSKYIPTGAVFNNLATTVDVYGGDVMTQKTWLKHVAFMSYDAVPGGSHWTNPGLGAGIAFYSQNRVNSQMINRNDSDHVWQYPTRNEEDWLNPIQPGAPILTYNQGYTIAQGISSNEAFDPSLITSESQSARIWWSDLKPQNSIVDNYTSFLPLNFKDLQMSFGEITHHINFNGQLLTFQPRHFEFQYFDSTGLLVTNAQEAVLGNAGVMSQRGTALSTYGTSHGFSVLKGKTAGGKDCIAWIDTVHGKCVKHDPSQGTSVISDIQFMRSFFNNNLRFAGLFDTPAAGTGIHGVWDDVNSEFIWTVRAWKSITEWGSGMTITNVQYISSTRTLITTSGSHGFNNGDVLLISGVTGFTNNPNGTHVAVLAGGNQIEINFDVVAGTYTGGGVVAIGTYNIGEVVAYGNANTGDNFHELPNFYRSLVNNNTTVPTDAVRWELIEKTDKDYYNAYTIAYNEVKNKFTTFYSYLPKIYLKRGKSFLSPRPITNQGTTYEHLRGDYCVWYGDGVTELAERWRIDGMSCNEQSNVNKSAKAMMWQTQLVPDRIEIETKNYSTFMVAADCERIEDQWKVAIKNDTRTSPTGANDGDTSTIFGSYVEVGISGPPRVFQLFDNFILKVRAVSRLFNT